MMQDVYQRASLIRLAIFDVDGVLTDGRLYYSDRGEELKVFDVRDGHGLKMLRESGLRLAVITSRTSQAVALRAANLGIDLVHQGVADKLAVFEALVAELKLERTATAYMGDDLIDLPVMRRCGLALSVPEAPAIVREHAHYVTAASAGRGAAREASELILRAQGKLDASIAVYLR